MNYEEAIGKLTKTLQELEDEGYDVAAVEDGLKISDEDGDNAYYFVLEYVREDDACVWAAFPGDVL